MTTSLQVSLYGLVMLAGGMLSLAEGATFPDALTIPLAVLALFLTERWKLFWLRTSWANGLGLLAFVVAGWELSSGEIEARLLSLAHLLVYLTWIVLFLSKTPRMYWNLCLLSVLHVAVGAVLTSSGVFGLLCAVFLVAAIWTLTLFTLGRARQKYVGQNELPPPSKIASAFSDSTGTQTPSTAFPWNRRSRPISTVQIDPRLRWVSGPFISGVLANVVLSSAVGGLFFLFTPRIWVGNFSAFGEAPDQPLRILQSGFADEVQLGDIGQILEGTQTVLEVRMFDEATRQPIDVMTHAARLGFDEPIFRGSVMGEYAKGRWRVGTTGRNDLPQQLRTKLPTDDYIRQEFRVEPMESGILFAMPQHVAGRLEHRLSLITERRVTSVLYRDLNISDRERLQYTIYSERPAQNADLPFPRGTHISTPYRSEIEYYRHLPERGLERLQALAQQISFPAEGGDSTPTGMARRIVRYLRDSGEFGYTLDMAVADPNIDAVEDFLFNRKQGHCEYFASALALMLRAVGVPTRLVSGFKGGDVNASTGYFVVQGRHAHVWVEALLEGRWRVLDATPAARSDSVKSLAPKASFFGTVTNFFNDLWSHQIVGLSFNDQSTRLYTPLKEWGSNLTETLREDLNDLLEGRTSSARLRRHLYLFAFAVLLIVGLIATLIAARTRWKGEGRVLARLRRFFKWLVPAEAASSDGGWRARWSRWWSALLRRLRGESEEQRLNVAFYERLLRLFRSEGLEPLPTQTAREFIVATKSDWSDRLAANGLANIPAEVVSQFYRVRFGAESLSLDELQRLDAQLDQLEQQLSQRNGER